MDQGPPPPREPRKHKFAPRLPSSSRRSRPPVQKQDDDQEKATQTGALQSFTATVAKKKSKTELKSPVHVAFQSPTSSTSIRSFGTPSEDNGNNSKNTDLEPPPSDTLPIAPSPIAKNVDKEDVHLLEDADADALAPKPASEYVGPWDRNSYHPTVLPLREPFSGDPEFGAGSKNMEWDESTINSAKELGLILEDQDKNKMILFQLPPLPRPKQPPNAVGKVKISSSTSMIGSEEASVLKDLPEGYMGKILVYKSGKIKLMLGDVPFDVSPGAPVTMPTDVAVINTKDQECCVLGSVKEWVVVTPDIDSL